MLKNFVDKIVRLFPIRKRQVLFFSYYGSQYGCNPKYISQYLAEDHSDDIDIIWAFTNPEAYNGIPKIRKVRFGSVAYRIALATSRIVCTNYRMTEDFCKRPGQTYIQTWHSSLRLKKIEKDTEATLPARYVDMAIHDSSQTDYVVAGSRFSHNTFAKSFWYEGEILDIGTPRNDLLVNADPQMVLKIKSLVINDIKKKIVLYAPTFRKNKATDCYNLDFAGLQKTLSDTFGGEWVVLVRLHPHLINYELFKNVPEVVDVTHYDDIQELLLISDILISDYSSLMFDFSISGKPVFLFTKDLDNYCENDRSLYFDINQLPFPLARDNDVLMQKIREFDKEEYSKGLAELNASVGSFETGTASAAVTKLITKIINS